MRMPLRGRSTVALLVGSLFVFQWSLTARRRLRPSVRSPTTSSTTGNRSRAPPVRRWSVARRIGDVGAERRRRARRPQPAHRPGIQAPARHRRQPSRPTASSSSSRSRSRRPTRSARNQNRANGRGERRDAGGATTPAHPRPAEPQRSRRGTGGRQGGGRQGGGPQPQPRTGPGHHDAAGRHR